MRIELDGIGGCGTWLTRTTFISKDETDRRGATIDSKREAIRYLWKSRKRTPWRQEPGIAQFRLAETFRRMWAVLRA